MLIGLLADIHEAIEPLDRSLDALRSRGVTQIVSLGDACDTFSPVGRAAEVASRLEVAGAIGVWGNHDIGLCYQVPGTLRQKTASSVLKYMSTMRPYLSFDDCRFSHVEPWLDACKVEDLWYFDGPPDTPEKAARTFAAVPERYSFIGHFHRWLITTPERVLDWRGESAIDLDKDRCYVVVIAPVVSGWCATFDTDSKRLTPIDIRSF